MPDRWASDAACPVKFDADTGEYSLLGDGRIAIMYFCFSCGGRLPESKRSALFSAPNDADSTEVAKFTVQIKTTDDALRLLGEPDEIFDGRDYSPTMGPPDWTRTLRYSTKWQSLFLDVQELPDGTARCLYGGKYVGPRNDPRAGRPRRAQS